MLWCVIRVGLVSFIWLDIEWLDGVYDMMWFCGVYVMVVCDVGGFWMWFRVVYVVAWLYYVIKRFLWSRCVLLWLWWGFVVVMYNSLAVTWDRVWNWRCCVCGLLVSVLRYCVIIPLWSSSLRGCLLGGEPPCSPESAKQPIRFSEFLSLSSVLAVTA